MPARRLRLAMPLVLLLILWGMLPPARPLSAAVASPLRYQFQTGAAATVAFTSQEEDADVLGGKPRSYLEQLSGLEQGVVTQVFTTGASLVQYRFAQLVDAHLGVQKRLSTASYLITQEVEPNGVTYGEDPQCTPASAFAGHLRLLALAPVPYPARSVTPGDTWIAPYTTFLPTIPGPPTARVHWLARAGDLGTFQETAVMVLHGSDPGDSYSNTTLITQTVQQNLTTGIPVTWHYVYDQHYRETLSPAKGSTAAPVTNIWHLHKVFDARSVPDARFAGGIGASSPSPTPSLTPTPIATQTPPRTPTPATTATAAASPHPNQKGMPPGAAQLPALNASPADLPSCYRVRLSQNRDPATAVTHDDMNAISGSGFLYEDEVDLISVRPGVTSAQIVAGLLSNQGADDFDEVLSDLLLFPDAATAHAYAVQVVHRFRPSKISAPVPTLVMNQVGEDSGADYVADLNEYEFVFRRGRYVDYLVLIGQFIPADLGIYAQKIDERLQQVAGNDS